MFTKLRSQKNSLLLVALLSFLKGSSLIFAADTTEGTMQWLKGKIKSRPNALNIIVLGPPNDGKSTLINLLMHVSEYATRETSGPVLRDSSDRIKPIYQNDMLRFDVKKQVNPRYFKATNKPTKTLNYIPSISAFMPVFGPIPVFDFLIEESLTSFNDDLNVSGERMLGGMSSPHVYRSQVKVNKPVFRSTFVDTPAFHILNRLTFFKEVLEESPSDGITALLIVISADTLASSDYTPDNFPYFTELTKILNQFDPTFNQVLLAVTHAGSERLHSKISSKDNSRHFASVAFKKLTGMVVSTGNIFFFENRYNCLSPSAVDALYDCYAGGTPNNLDVQEAFFHRQKNYQANVLESFNLLKTAAKIKPSLSRSKLIKAVDVLAAREQEEIEEGSAD